MARIACLLCLSLLVTTPLLCDLRRLTALKINETEAPTAAQSAEKFGSLVEEAAEEPQQEPAKFGSHKARRLQHKRAKNRKREAPMLEIMAMEILSWLGPEEWMKLSDLISQLQALGDSAPNEEVISIKLVLLQSITNQLYFAARSAGGDMEVSLTDAGRGKVEHEKALAARREEIASVKEQGGHVQYNFKAHQAGLEDQTEDEADLPNVSSLVEEAAKVPPDPLDNGGFGEPQQRRHGRNSGSRRLQAMRRKEKQWEASLVETTAIKILSWLGPEEWMKLSDLISQILSLGVSGSSSIAVFRSPSEEVISIKLVLLEFITNQPYLSFRSAGGDMEVILTDLGRQKAEHNKNRSRERGAQMDIRDMVRLSKQGATAWLD